MLEFNAKAFYQAGIALRTIRMVSLGVSKEHGAEAMERQANESFLASIRPSVDDLKSSCETMAVLSTTDAVERLSEAVNSKSRSYRNIDELVRDVEMGLADDLKRVNMIVLDPKHAAFFSNAMTTFGVDVNSKFQSALFEIDEASKCFALGRWTATVFHLMRLLEINIRAISRCLGVPDPTKPSQRNWGHILKTIDTAIKNKRGQWSIADDEEFFDGVYILLDRVRNNWRNSTMHVENKYIEEEAREILDSVRAFMKKVASRLDEDGTPFA